jgi:hypothetical protein
MARAISAHGQDADTTLSTLFMAAVAGETIKGYQVAHEACQILRLSRSDFRLAVRFDPAGQNQRLRAFGRLVFTGRSAAPSPRDRGCATAKGSERREVKNSGV